MHNTNFLPLSIAWHKIDYNQEFFKQLYHRDSYIDAAYAFSTKSIDILAIISNILSKSRSDGLPQPHTEKKVRSFISRFNALVHLALMTYPTHGFTSQIILGFAGLINSIEDSKICIDIKPLLREYVEYFFYPYVKQVRP